MSTDASSYKPPSSSHSDARRASNSSASSSSTSDSSESHSDLYFNSSDSAAASSSTGDTDTDTSSGDDDDDEEMPGLEPAMEEDDEEDDEDDWHGPYGGGPEVDGHGFNGDDEAEEDDESDGEDWFQDDEEISRRRTGFARLVAGEYRRLYSKRYLKPHHRQRERGPARLPFVLTHVKTHNPETFRSILRVSLQRSMPSLPGSPTTPFSSTTPRTTKFPLNSKSPLFFIVLVTTEMLQGLHELLNGLALAKDGLVDHPPSADSYTQSRLPSDRSAVSNRCGEGGRKAMGGGSFMRSLEERLGVC